MRFTRLRLNGFKSFVDPTDLVIHDGLTGVVGPNGCGKSNLLEALRWVMGENRPTAMRGGGMEDVIFAGTSGRPARHHAEVSLVLDNSERLAPAAFNDTDTLDIVRRITRDAGSAYKIGAKDVRARDVQMLFADASTGAHSPALVRQGQISELINAKPKARRRILEEAAGISGLYQRRHEAELKLKAAEQNLTRVDDVIDQLAGQIGQLAKQAKQAGRYRDIAEALRKAEGALLYRRWAEAEAGLQQAESILRERVADAVKAEKAAQSTVESRQKAEDALPPLREEDAIAASLMQRIEVERNTLSDRERQAHGRIAGLGKRMDQIDRDIARESDLNKDAGQTIVTLEDEAAQIEAAAQGHDGRVAVAAQAVQEAGEVLAARESDLSTLTEDVASLAAQHQSAQKTLRESQQVLTRSHAAAKTAAETRDHAQAALSQAQQDHQDAESAVSAATDAARAAEDALQQVESARADIQTQEAEARATLSTLEATAKALTGEITALQRLVAQDAAGGNQVLDHITVAAGYEQALGAALADDLKAPMIDGNETGWAALPDYDAVQPLPDGVVALAGQVTAPAVLARRLTQIGIVTRADGARLQPALRPGQRLVSLEGDLWRWDGYRTHADTTPSAAALRLQQKNRLTELQGELSDAEAEVNTAKAAHTQLAKDLTRLSEADKTAREARRKADQHVTDITRKLTQAEAAMTRAEGRLETSAHALTRHEEEAETAQAALTEAEATLQTLGNLDAARRKVEDVKMTVEAARMTMIARKSAHDETIREGEARTRRAAQITHDLESWRTRLQTASARADDLTRQRKQAEHDLEKARGVPASLAAERADLTARLAEVEKRRAAARAALDQGESAVRDAAMAERDAERAASEAREARAAAEARRDGACEASIAAEDRIDEVLETTPADLLARLALPADDIPAAEQLEDDIARLKRQRDTLGAVNLRAEEDAKEVQDEHDTLTREKADLEEAIQTLRSGIAALNREGRERILAAFEEVNSNFGVLFKHLFGGGEARLVMVESDDPLDAGLEIMCQPPGKKLATLSLLSGGEQTLTALALIFAVFLANPAPICVLDEVDAPLDDANVGRFCDLLDEMTRRTNTRFLIITHHAVTMSRMDRLFGVTMAEQGVSQLVSVDLKKAESLVA